MNFEKIAFMLLLKYAHHFGDIKTHLKNALREMILAAITSMKVMQTTIQEHQDPSQNSTLQNILDKADFFLKFALAKLPNQISDEEPIDKTLLKQEIWESVISALEEEIENISEQNTSTSKMQIDALEAIRQALLKKADAEASTYNLSQNSGAPSRKAI